MITLKYELDNISVSLDVLINEIEYGTTFALYGCREETIPLAFGQPLWLRVFAEDKIVSIEIEDSFLEIECFFEKLIVAFLYNLLDFGNLRLISIQLSQSIISTLCRHQHLIPKYHHVHRNDLLLGTILKPYYHLTLTEKLKMISTFLNYGLNIIKEDETYLVPKKRLREEVNAIQGLVKNLGIFVPNITPYIYDYLFIEELLSYGIEIAMVDFLVTGFRSIYDLKLKFPELRIWGHRVGYRSVEKFLSMEALSTIAALSGIDFLHIGTPVNRDSAIKKLQLVTRIRPINSRFIPVFTKTSPDILTNLVDLFDDQAVLMACGYFRDSKGAINWENVQKWVSVAHNARLGRK